MMLANFFRKLIYPPHCISCGKPGAWICLSCENLLLMRAPPECVVCRKISNGYRTHKECRNTTTIRQAIICWRYNDLAKDSMKNLKYNFRYEIADTLAKLASEIASTHLPGKFTLIPVPTTPSRVRERGFNQSEIIADALMKHLPAKGRHDITVKNLLLKRARGKSQSGKSREERMQSFQRDILLRPGQSNPVLDSTLILVDDVCTTGTTLHNSAAVLSETGCTDIRAITLFRGKPRYSRERKSQIPQEPQDAHEPPQVEGGSKSPSLSESFPEN